MNCAECVYGRFPRITASSIHNAELAIVGEAPGVEEIRVGKPFVGPSGQLLLKALKVTGLLAKEELLHGSPRVFVTNSLMCRPPKGPIKKEAVLMCRDRLLAELNEVQPRLVLALGAHALHSITGNFGSKITAEQGRIQEAPDLHSGIQVIAAVHPASILRNPGEYKNFYAALKYAAQLLGGREPLTPGVTEWFVAYTERDVQEVVNTLRNLGREGPYLAGADIETTGLTFWKGRILVIGIAFDKNRVIVVPEERIPDLKEAFELPNIDWGWQTGKFDVSFLRRRGLRATVHEDALLLHYCLDETTGTHDLEQQASRYLGAAPYKAEANQMARRGSKATATKKGFAELPKAILYKRVAIDADYTRQLIIEHSSKVNADPGLSSLYRKILIPGSEFLRQVERVGMFVNVEVVKSLGRKYTTELEGDPEEPEKRGILQDIADMARLRWDPSLYQQDTGARKAGPELDPRSPKQLGWFLFNKLHLKSRKFPRVHSTRKEILEDLQGQHPIVDSLLEMRKIEKRLSTYVSNVLGRLDSNSRIHTTFLLHGTATGRLSSRNPNFQNIPRVHGGREIRDMFQAPPGRLLMEADYKGAELRVLAHLSGDEDLTAVFRDGRDLHDEVASEFFGPNFAEDDRMRAKAVNFGVIYGRAEYSLAREFDIPVEQAREWIDLWFRRFKRAAAYLRSCDQAVVEGRILTTPFGRKRRFGLVTAQNLRDLQNEARNFRIQSVASDLTLLAAMRVHAILKEMDVHVINLVHDNHLSELPADRELLRQAALLVVREMCQTPITELRSVVPFEVEIKVGTAWGSLKEEEELNTWLKTN